ncbi:DUF2911 domain-containing protein [Runella rosea]|uniref:DUF2911 domain-containing protein n=1 Tax=Runella rosea TaxID=2259595 RepID=A0A344TGN0_9BACT|nr:DUF2911 domain-containing protein [Runella rosea]AXE17801.1 DUF2911 domain-containing protein [Runella rosea]
MKKTTLIYCMLSLLALGAYAQGFRAVDKSSLDYAYFPDHFAHDRKDGEKALVRVTYSRPAKNGREVFGKLVPYGKVWRTGANENTEIKFYQDATIQGKKVKAGTYSLFTIPGETEWTIILNSDLDYWGAFKYKEANDVARFTVPSKKSTDAPLEHFSIQFPKGTDAILRMGWDNTIVEVPITF